MFKPLLARDRPLLIVGVFCLIWAVYFASGNYPSSDSMWSVPLARSIAREGNFDLDEYQPPTNDYRVKRVGGHYYSAFPAGGPLLMIRRMITRVPSIRKTVL